MRASRDDGARRAVGAPIRLLELELNEGDRDDGAGPVIVRLTRGRRGDRSAP